MVTYTDLLPHQAAAVDKLRHLKIGALYMEMGTGKTRTTLELIKLRLDVGKIDHVIWLCPCSVKTNLRLDIIKHSDLTELPGVLTICGIETLSSSIRVYNALMNIVMTTNCMLIVDESNLVKNSFAIRSKNITSLAQQCPYRYILNGTPISKNEADLFSQWYILDKRILGYESYYSFARNHLEYDEKFKGKVRRVLHVDYLTDKISPYCYQVKKEECLTLPEKNYSTYTFNLDYAQTVHYYDVLNEFLSAEALVKDYDTSAIYRTLTALQQVASGRYVVPDASKAIEHRPFFDEPADNPRINALLDVLKAPIRNGDKVVIWCRYDHEINDIISVLAGNGVPTTQFHGKLNQRKRQEQLDMFRGDVNILVANKVCAGYGLNLQFCHNAVYYSNDWDWATRAQSEDRLHRFGQDQPVNYIDLCSDAKIEERILHCLWRKGNLVDDFKGQLSNKKELRAWLGGDKGDLDRLDADAQPSSAEKVQSKGAVK